MNDLVKEVDSISKGSTRASELIISTLSDALKLQTTSVMKECRECILKRGIDKSVILNVNDDIQCIVSTFLKHPYSDRDAVLKFQHGAYLKLEIGYLERETTKLNSLVANRIRSSPFVQMICSRNVRIS